MLHRRNDDGPLPPVRRRPTVHPIFPVGDVTTAAEFYRGLGFDVRLYDENYAWVTHGGWEWFHLARVEHHDPSTNHSNAYLHVADASAWHAAMTLLAGDSVEIAPLVDTPWGKHEFSFSDPDGNSLRIGSPL